jgi:hypothetical protein
MNPGIIDRAAHLFYDAPRETISVCVYDEAVGRMAKE